MSDVDRHELRIGVLGSYGGLNLGDEAILACVLDSLRQIRPTAERIVFSRHPEHTSDRFGIPAVAYAGVSQGQLVEAETGLDLLVLGGGGILHNGLAASVMRPVRLAHQLGIPTFGYAIGAGPLTGHEEIDVVRQVIDQMTDLTVRDQESILVLEGMGVTRQISATADAAVLLDPEEFTEEMLIREGIDAHTRLVGISVREPGGAADNLDERTYHGLIAEIADFMTCRYNAQAVFVPMERGDIAHAHAVLSAMSAPENARILNRPYSPGQIAGLMRHLEFAVGMRLHFLIFAACAGVPVLPLPYAGKVFDFAQTVGAPALTGIAKSQAGPLLAQLDRLWDERHACTDRLRQRFQFLRERARENQERCRTLIDRLDPVS
ncbi:polysaccharide pyruvyl transferase family protein [Actinoallomurus soli]|uniref:polysaccharide pyruvyl transferase family protein n=1 Tax=Actinoallomurus soli TaxID=2952535 RepID=UPI0020935DDF|nr:polysaccharide pyruvyl transferase family protein [Actinoallomurus soli]MCO5967726.1 polysaccharide pyruvyl transferase family protein [Actinoallomurus soli]